MPSFQHRNEGMGAFPQRRGAAPGVYIVNTGFGEKPFATMLPLAS
jgi:hypothetical protein